jgi:hypothetical protein
LKSLLHKGAIGLVLVGAGVLAGGTVSSVKLAHGELRSSPPSPPFQSGAQLSVPVLREIAATLQQIDSRLARLERVAQKLQPARPAAPSATRLNTGD